MYSNDTASARVRVRETPLESGRPLMPHRPFAPRVVSKLLVRFGQAFNSGVRL